MPYENGQPPAASLAGELLKESEKLRALAAANGQTPPETLAIELRTESDRLRQLAEQAAAQEKKLADIDAEYPALRKYAYEKLLEEMGVPEEIPDGDLERYIKEHGGLPLDAFIDEIEESFKKAG